MLKKNRICVDTSVFGGVFDAAFSESSQRFFDEVRAEKHIVLISDVIYREISRAPIYIRQFLKELPPHNIEKIEITEEMIVLTHAYIKDQVITERWIDDAVQVAIATVARADAMISWNFKHLVNWERIRGFNSVNLKLGYPMITILTPRQVIKDEEEL